MSREKSQPAQPLLTLLGATDVLRLPWSLAGAHSPTALTFVPGRLAALEEMNVSHWSGFGSRYLE